jgi:hypothetical protein
MGGSAYHRLWLPWRLPGLNEIIGAAKGCGGRGLGYSTMKSKTTQDIAWQIKAARIPPLKAARFKFTWAEPSRQRDKDNIAAGRKFIMDAFKLVKVWGNDGWKQVIGWSDEFQVSDKPGVLVEIFPEE